MENGKIENVRSPKPLNHLIQNLSWVITPVTSPDMPRFKMVAASFGFQATM